MTKTEYIAAIGADLTAANALCAELRTLRNFKKIAKTIPDADKMVAFDVMDKAITSKEGELQKLRSALGKNRRIVKKLEDQGFIAREREPSDRRQLLIRATEEGRNQSRLRQEKRRRESQELMKALDSAEQERLLELLTKLLDSWEDRDPHNHPHHRPSPLEGGGEG